MLVGDDRLTALCAELEGAVSLRTDVVVRDEVKALVAKAEESFGKGVDVLVNVAGVMYFTMMKNCQEEEWERTVDVNCKGVMHGFGAVLKAPPTPLRSPDLLPPDLLPMAQRLRRNGRRG